MDPLRFLFGMAEVRMKSVMSSSSRRVLGVCPGAGLRWPVVAGAVCVVTGRCVCSA